MESAANDNIFVLRQAVALLDELDEVAYTKPCPACYNRGIGPQMRHAIDHYLCFLKGYTGGEVDYDARTREPRLEEDPAYVASVVLSIIDELERIPAELADAPLRVQMDTGEAPSADTLAQSSVRRELQFLLSHTIHHFALIYVIASLEGRTLPEHFGVAPATIKHQQRVCAQ